MKSLFTFLISFVALISSAQDFLPQNSGVTTQLNAIEFATPSSGIVVGKSGVIRRTSNSGLDWLASTSGTTAELTDVVSLGPTSYLVVGRAGTLLKTTNSGGNWTMVNSGTMNDLLSIYVNGQYVYITGANGTILKSSNYGGAWSTLSTGISLDLNDAYFVSENTGYVVGDAGTILKTVNGGGTWTIPDSGASGFSLRSVCFPDGMNGVITGANSNTNQSIMLNSSNAGLNWDSESYPNMYLNRMSFYTNQEGYAVGGSIPGNSSNIYKTTDNGSNWTAVTSSSSRQLSVFMVNSNLVYTCGLDGTILRYAASTVGVQESQDDLSFVVSPNPSSGIFTVMSDMNSDENYSVQIFSADSRFLFELENAKEIDLSAFPTGVYLAVISSNSTPILKRLVKE